MAPAPHHPRFDAWILIFCNCCARCLRWCCPWDLPGSLFGGKAEPLHAKVNIDQHSSVTGLRISAVVKTSLLSFERHMISNKHILALVVSFCFVNAAHAQTAAAPTSDVAPPQSLTGNIALVSDYRFRGVSQSYRQPAVQGGFDYAHASGLYLGNWNSSVSSNSYNNGAGLEMDLYGGYRFALTQEIAGDVGVLHYFYPSARLNSGPATPTNNQYNTTEVYFGLSQGALNGKLSYAVSNYFGLNGTTAGYAYFSALPNRGDSKGTTYLDLNYGIDLGNKLMLGLHAGYTSVRRYSELSYTDFKVSVGKEFSGMAINLALVGTNADSRFYQTGDSSGLNAKQVGKTGFVISASKSF